MTSNAFEKLTDFLKHRMRMSHIYQPVMLKVLLEKGGRASAKQIATAFLAEDESQLEYYEQITNRMPGPVLQNHGLVVRKGTDYMLEEELFNLSDIEKAQLITLCDERMQEYKQKRGSAIWQHRTAGLGYVPGKIRYEVLKRAGFRCELCGVSADERSLEVDHILPQKHGGSDELLNFQALCWKCNANKGAGDDTDFRGVKSSYAERQQDCVFCDISSDRIVNQNELAVVIHDAYPVVSMHTLIIPMRHETSFFQLYRPEVNAINDLIHAEQVAITRLDSMVEGFNVGINIGEPAGQTIFHCHIHLIPRRLGDVVNPRGGVRAVIPGKSDYR